MVRKKTSLIAHRCNGYGYLENSKKAILKALKTPKKGIEIDVRLTKDKHFVLFHDSYLDRLTTSKGKVSKKTLAQLQKITLVDGSKIPTLEEMLPQISKKQDKLIFFDYKEKKSEKEFIQLLKRHHCLNVSIGSWDPQTLENISLIAPNIKTYLLYVPLPRALNFLRFTKLFNVENESVLLHINKYHKSPAAKLVYLFSKPPRLPYLTGVGLPSYLCTKRLIKACKKRGLKIISFPINDHNIKKQLLHSVEYLITDKPRSL